MSSIFYVKFWIVGAVAYTAFTAFLKKKFAMFYSANAVQRAI